MAAQWWRVPPAEGRGVVPHHPYRITTTRAPRCAAAAAALNPVSPPPTTITSHSVPMLI